MEKNPMLTTIATSLLPSCRCPRGQTRSEPALFTTCPRGAWLIGERNGARDWW